MRMRVALAAHIPLLLACASGDVPASTSGATEPPGSVKPVSFSILEDYDKGEDLAQIALDFELMKALDVRVWRGSFGWDDYEPVAGEYDFAWLNEFVALAAQHGIELRPYIGYTAPWAARGGGEDDEYWNDPPRDAEQWYAFVHRIVSELRKHGNVESYEIYNEVNARLWWDGSPEEYNRVLARGAEAVRAADPEAEVVLAGFTFPDADWLREVCVAHRNGNEFAIAAFHAYPETWTPDTVTVENFLDTQYHDYFVPTVRNACGGQPIWINEMGYATTPGRTEEQQASWWVRAVATFLADRSVEHIGVYEIKDLRKDSPVIGDAPNYYLGLTYTDRRKKLAFHTVDMLTDLLDVDSLEVLDSATTVTLSGGSAGELHHHVFRRPDGDQVVIVWDRTGSPVVGITLPSRGATAVEYLLDGRQEPHVSFGDATLSGVALQAGMPRIFRIQVR